MKKYIVISLLTVSCFGSLLYGQDAKYMVVPIQFEFLKGRDQFRANTLLRYLFKENGYNTFFDEEELPDDLFKDRCLAHYSDVKKITSGLNIKVQIEIKDCKGNLLFLSDIGKSKEKDLSKGYKLAIEDAFQSLKEVNITSGPDELEQLLAEEEGGNEMSREPQEKQAVVAAVAVEASKEEVVDSKSPVASVKKEEVKETLFAKATEDGGYQVFNMEPRIVMELEKSDIQDVFKVKGEDGILFKRGEFWIHAKTVEGKTIEKKYHIKF